jgi:hypothetical protein
VNLKSPRLWKSEFLSLSPIAEAVLIFFLLAGCSTITAYSKEIARESPRFGTLTKMDAVAILKLHASVSGEIADYGSFVVDEEGFIFKKTTEEVKTEWKHKKPVKVKSTSWVAWDVPWNAINEITPYMEEYQAPFPHIRYRVRLDYSINTVKYSSRVKEGADIVFDCQTYEALVDVTAALKTLTDL